MTDHYPAPETDLVRKETNFFFQVGKLGEEEEEATGKSRKGGSESEPAPEVNFGPSGSAQQPQPPAFIVNGVNEALKTAFSSHQVYGPRGNGEITRAARVPFPRRPPSYYFKRCLVSLGFKLAGL